MKSFYERLAEEFMGNSNHRFRIKPFENLEIYARSGTEDDRALNDELQIWDKLWI